MGCKALTYADGSWYCGRCSVGGDKDEDPEEYCHGTANGDAPVGGGQLPVADMQSPGRTPEDAGV